MKKKITYMLAAVASMAGVAVADLTHTVPDAGFEDNPIAAGGFDYVEDAYTDGSTPWMGHNWQSSWSYICDTTQTYPQYGNGGSDQYVRAWKAYTYQTLSDTFVEDRTYTLTLYAAAAAGSSSMHLYIADGTSLTGNQTWSDGYAYVDQTHAVPIDPDSSDGYNNWTAYTAEYTALAADAGKPIAVCFYGTNYVYMDDVSLTSIPEPATLGLVGLMGGGLLWVRKHFLI